MTTMKAVHIHSYGSPEVLTYENALRPEPSEGEVLIRVQAAGVNPIDWKIRSGQMKDIIPYKLPLILGWDIAGVVDAVGSGVSSLKVGSPVYGSLNMTRNGAYAEYAVAGVSDVALKPTTLKPTQASAVPVVALTAWQALFEIGRLSAGQRVLIHGGAGGVGSLAVQLAKWKGAWVIATASAHNHYRLQELGADQILDYNAVRFEDVVQNVDVVLDTIGGDTQERSWGVLKKGGVLISTISLPSKQIAATYGVRGEMLFVQPNSRQLTEIAQLIDAGQIRFNVETVLPLAEVHKAHDLGQRGQIRGKIVLQVAD
ncbi:NADP-dependent oxidoreductase [Nostoc sp. NOS(2021)]|uniref:NADP-dependent oxidoreductase n=1 Tax=Nostoc sp. NOS(2021) TaxID=2815407 RepID=UPI0025FCFB19|nr:NADP-dependent oxidoreductase [Nostoc sp. NOS(2021)]